MPKPVVTRDRDRGWRKLRNTLKSRRLRYVDTGILSRGDIRADNIGNIMLAWIHEFGLGNVPERSFIRDTVDANSVKYVKLLKALSYQIMVGKISKRQALLIVGAKVESDMKRRVRAGISPANAPSTVAAKGSTVPLIDTGQMLSAIDYEVGP